MLSEKFRDILILCAAAVFTWIMFAALLPGPSFSLFSDYWDYLQIGREIADGHGFTSKFTYPALLKYAEPGDSTFPVLWRGPAYPYFLAILYSFVGHRAGILLHVNALFFVLTIPFIYLIGRTLFSRGAGVVASLLFMLSSEILDVTTLGYPTTELVFFFVLSTFLLSGTPSARRALLSGFWFALGVLTQISFIIYLPVLSVYGFYQAEKKRGLVLAALLSFPVISFLAFQARNWIVTGNPVFTTASFHMSFYPIIPLWKIARSVDPAMQFSASFLFSNFLTVVSQCAINFQRYIWAFPGFLGTLGLSFFILSFFLRWPKNETARFVKFVLVSLVVGVLALAPFVFDTMLLLPLIPLCFILASGACFSLLKKLGREVFFLRNTLLIVVSLMLLAQMRTVSLKLKHGALDLDRVSVEEDMKAIGRDLKEGDLVISDIPDFVAWYTGMSGLWLPDFDQLDKALSMVHAEAIYLSPQYGKILSTSGDSWWNRVASGTRVLPEFPVRKKFGSGGILLLKGA
ncbi:MAG: glycosyltransferase family 39 protein [Candidatus Eisenbacteria bacterium]|nr:glycosyltransferase family 39 protein [Candidatus Eisenbacteria bacterium]